MNRFLNIFFLLFMSFGGFGQNKNWSSELLKMSETDSLYLTAIEKYTIEIDSFYNKYSQTKQPTTIFIENQEYVSKIPDSINGFRIQKIGLGNRKKIFRENKNKLRYVKVSPLTIRNGEFSITLTPYFAELKGKNHLFLSLSDWTRVFFEFKNGRLIYKKTENGGI
ncbi:MAG: hypothetical protein HS119_05895 [Flavobacteriales bacterium]|nr:hypothetical protein [Flavobacteriales bacterium]